jgi:hypothetical protein
MKIIRKRLIFMIIAIIISFFVRPHITLFLLLSFGLGVYFDKKIKPSKRIFILLILSTGFIYLFNYVMDFIELESLDAEAITAYSDKNADLLGRERTGSAVNTKSYSYPFKIFTFLYRPLFFDGLSILGIISSFENLILLFFTVKILLNKPLRAFKNANFVLKGTIIFFIIGSLAFSLVLGNLGIMARAKTPFIAGLIIFLYWVLVNNKFHKRV